MAAIVPWLLHCSNKGRHAHCKQSPTEGVSGATTRSSRIPDRTGSDASQTERTIWPQVTVLLAGFAALVSAGVWIVLTPANKPPPRAKLATEPLTPIRLITFDRPFPPDGRFVADPYVGSRVCADCHPAESAQFIHDLGTR